MCKKGTLILNNMAKLAIKFSLNGVSLLSKEHWNSLRHQGGVLMRFVSTAAPRSQRSLFRGVGFGMSGRSRCAPSCRSLITQIKSGSGKEEQYRLLVVGGGAGGCAMAAIFSRQLPEGAVGVLEPSHTHYYQPMFTLVGGGLVPMERTNRPMENVLPPKARWIKDEARFFVPERSEVMTKGGRVIRYDYMIIAMGIVPLYEEVPGLKEALMSENSGVSCNYCPEFVENSFKYLESFKGGRIISTFPSTPVKCPGAPQKYLYLADDYLRRHQLRESAEICYHTSLSSIFGVPYYSAAMQRIADDKGIEVNVLSELVELNWEVKEAVFRQSYKDSSQTVLKTESYALLHATPPQGPPPALRECDSLVHKTSRFLEVNPRTLQHVRFANIWGVGDALDVPTSRTAAGAATQCGVVRRALTAVMRGDPPPADATYDGYASCPLVTRDGACVLAEFKYEGAPAETFPVDQRRERWLMYQVKARALPYLYWNLMLRGYWEGPQGLRKILRLGGLI